MEKEFVTYKQALALKELGFDEMCFGYFDSKSELAFNTNGNPISKDWVWFGNQCLPVDMTLAPLKQQVFRWFREKYDLHSYVFAWLRRVGWGYDIPNESSTVIQTDDNTFTTYEEAENACIDKLIEIAKQ
jgi:hypothetical protein